MLIQIDYMQNGVNPTTLFIDVASIASISHNVEANSRGFKWELNLHNGHAYMFGDCKNDDEAYDLVRKALIEYHERK